MVMPMTRLPKQTGFTLIELSIVMMIGTLLASTLASIWASNRSRDIQINNQDVAIGQMQRIAQAAQIFRLENTGLWPDEANLCAGAFTALYIAGRLRGVSNTSPFNTVYSTSCTTGLAGQFFVSVDAATEVAASTMGNALPANTVAGSTVTGIWSVAGAEPAMDALLDLAGTKAMSGPLDMGGNTLINADDVITATGQSLASAVVFKSELLPGESINRPTCPSGMTAEPFVDGFRRTSLPSNGAIHSSDVQITPLANGWRFDPVVVGPSGPEVVTGTHVRFTVSIKCI